MEFAKNKRDYRITVGLKEKGDIRLFSKINKIEIDEMFGMDKVIANSDLLPYGFFYKPFTFNQVMLSDEEEHKFFKKVKVAKYIEADLIRNISSAKELLQGLLNGCLNCEDDMIASADFGFSDRKKNVVDSDKEQPIKIQLEIGTKLDIYVTTIEEIDKSIYGDKKVFLLGGMKVSIEGIEEIYQNESKRYVIQTKSYISDDTFLGEYTKSVFRVGYSENEGQFFLPGSTFDISDRLGVDRKVNNPFRLCLREV